jgi:carbon storage regulator
MLVLSRKVGERILVPHCGLAITLVAVDGKQVRLGISAPTELGVYREEVWHKLRRPRAVLTATVNARADRAGSRRPAPE